MNLSAFAAMASALFALVALLLTRKVLKQTENLSRQANYTRLHELLVDPKAACGRRKLYMAYARKKFPQMGDPDWDDINYSLALYDTLGGYLKHGLVDRELALAAWHEPLTRIAMPANHFINVRALGESARPWAFLTYLLESAEAYSHAHPSAQERNDFAGPLPQEVAEGEDVENSPKTGGV